MTTAKLTILIVTMTLVGIGGPIAAMLQAAAAADNDSLRTSTPIIANNEQNSTINQVDKIEYRSDPLDAILAQLAQQDSIAADIDIENATATEIGDLLESFGLDTNGPVCPPCS
jgi:hypothetical protein